MFSSKEKIVIDIYAGGGKRKLSELIHKDSRLLNSDTDDSACATYFLPSSRMCAVVAYLSFNQQFRPRSHLHPCSSCSCDLARGARWVNNPVELWGSAAVAIIPELSLAIDSLHCQLLRMCGALCAGLEICLRASVNWFFIDEWSSRHINPADMNLGSFQIASTNVKLLSCTKPQTHFFCFGHDSVSPLSKNASIAAKLLFILRHLLPQNRNFFSTSALEFMNSSLPFAITRFPQKCCSPIDLRGLIAWTLLYIPGKPREDPINRRRRYGKPHNAYNVVKGGAAGVSV